MSPAVQRGIPRRPIRIRIRRLRGRRRVQRARIPEQGVVQPSHGLRRGVWMDEGPGGSLSRAAAHGVGGVWPVWRELCEVLGGDEGAGGEC